MASTVTAPAPAPAAASAASVPDGGQDGASSVAGPSRIPLAAPIDVLDESEETADREAFLRRKKEYSDLAQSVEASDELLRDLASYLSTFQENLSDVSGQISDLQQKSDDIERQLKGRRTIVPPLNALLGDIMLPPSLVLTLRDTQPSQNPDLWLSAVSQLEEKILATKSRSRVRAAHDLDDILEPLVVRVLHQLPPFLLTLIRPLRSASKGLSSNLAVLQTSLLLKYKPFYWFLVRQSPRHAKLVERGYVSAARSYFETGFRRYARALGQVKARTTEKGELIGVVSSEAAQAVLNRAPPSIRQAYERIKYASLDPDEGEDGAGGGGTGGGAAGIGGASGAIGTSAGGAGLVTLAYQADDKDLKLPVEALFRSLALVLVDNASAEFTFIVRFFARAPSGVGSAASAASGARSPVGPGGSGGGTPSLLPRSREATPVDSPNMSYLDAVSDAGRSRAGAARRRPIGSLSNTTSTDSDAGLKDAERIWHEVFDPALDYCTSFFQSILTPTPPPAIPLLTLIRLNDRLLSISESRGALPLVPYLTGWKLALWPVYRREMDAHVESLKKLADEAEGKGLSGVFGKGVKDGAVSQVAMRYAGLFSCVVALSDEAEEAMMFSSMSRLRTELIRLAQTQAGKIKDPTQRHSFLSSLYEVVIHELVSGPGKGTHPKVQAELSFFRTREEEARRRISA